MQNPTTEYLALQPPQDPADLATAKLVLEHGSPLLHLLLLTLLVREVTRFVQAVTKK